MKRFVTTAIAVLLTATALDAQSTERRERIKQEILEKQRLMREGKLVRANVRVTVRLNNGSRLRGVVKDGRFIERLDEREFVEARKPGPNSGLRLWYYDDTNSYIFLPYRSVKKYRIGERLTDAEVQAIAKRIDEQRKKAESKRDNYLAKKAAAEEARRRAREGNGAETPAKPEVEQESQLTADQRALLAEFPPEQGWGLDRLQSIEKRKVTVGVFPSKSEQRFIDNFSMWNQAYELQQAEKEAVTPKPTPKPTDKPTDKPAPKPAQPITPVPVPTGSPLPMPGGTGK